MPGTVSFVSAPLQISVITPPGSPGSAADISVSDPGGQSVTIPGAFVYFVFQRPTDVDLRHQSQLWLRLRRNERDPSGLGICFWSFGYHGAIPCGQVQVTSTTQAVCVTGAGSSGPANVVVNNTDGSSAVLSAGFTYTLASGNPAPFLTSIAPATGSTDGGDFVTLYGTHFLGGMTVQIGGADCSNPWLCRVRHSTCLTPPGAASGAVNVVAKNLDGQSSTLALGFTYSDDSGSGGGGSNSGNPTLPAPTLTSLSPRPVPQTAGLK